MKSFKPFLAVLCLVLSLGVNSALAGGVSDTSSEAYHCYLFFAHDDGVHFAQVMVNDEDPDVAEFKVGEALLKYGFDMGFDDVDDIEFGDRYMTLVASVGNLHLEYGQHVPWREDFEGEICGVNIIEVPQECPPVECPPTECPPVDCETECPIEAPLSNILNLN